MADLKVLPGNIKKPKEPKNKLTEMLQHPDIQSKMGQIIASKPGLKEKIAQVKADKMADSIVSEKEISDRRKKMKLVKAEILSDILTLLKEDLTKAVKDPYLSLDKPAEGEITPATFQPKDTNQTSEGVKPTVVAKPEQSPDFDPYLQRQGKVGTQLPVAGKPEGESLRDKLIKEYEKHHVGNIKLIEDQMRRGGAKPEVVKAFVEKHFGDFMNRRQQEEESKAEKRRAGKATEVKPEVGGTQTQNISHLKTKLAYGPTREALIRLHDNAAKAGKPIQFAHKDFSHSDPAVNHERIMSFLKTGKLHPEVAANSAAAAELTNPSSSIEPSSQIAQVLANAKSQGKSTPVRPEELSQQPQQPKQMFPTKPVYYDISRLKKR